MDETIDRSLLFCPQIAQITQIFIFNVTLAYSSHNSSIYLSPHQYNIGGLDVAKWRIYNWYCRDQDFWDLRSQVYTAHRWNLNPKNVCWTSMRCAIALQSENCAKTQTYPKVRWGFCATFSDANGLCRSLWATCVFRIISGRTVDPHDRGSNRRPYWGYCHKKG